MAPNDKIVCVVIFLSSIYESFARPNAVEGERRLTKISLFTYLDRFYDSVKYFAKGSFWKRRPSFYFIVMHSLNSEESVSLYYDK